MIHRRTEPASFTNIRPSTQQLDPVQRLYVAMKRYRSLAVSVARPVLMALVAILLILVVLPAALGAQAGAIR